MSVADNLKIIREKIARACAHSGRSPDAVKILAVTKLQSMDTLREAYAVGLVNFGENYVQEAQIKIRQCHDLPIVWHMIGSLQTNKIKDVVGDFAFIHSVDRLSLAQKINEVALQKKLRQKIFLQINFANEATKSGVAEGQAEDLFFRIVQLEGIEICGLMVMPPIADVAERSRSYFQKGQRLLDHLKSQSSKSNPAIPLQELSMGTSQDFEIAIEEGATWIRLGSMLLGERNKP